MDIADHTNKTGLYLSNGTYTPPYERKPTVPVMLYRGHTARLPKEDDESYYQKHVVRRYQMHALNAGFSGKDYFPLKDQPNFKVPSQRLFCPIKPRGKWTNFPMTVELGKYTRGFEGRYVSNPALPSVRERSKPPTPRARTTMSTRRSSNIPSRPLPSPLDFNMEARYYEAIETEISDIMAARNELFQSYQNRVENALMNDNDPSKEVHSHPVSRLGFTAHELVKPSTPVRPRASPFFVDGPNSNLLLPVPFVMPAHRTFKFQHKQRSYSAPVIDLPT